MYINSIELKNFRNHRDSNFEFEKGINLILGENGSGKTSILDAIGFALFNMKLRSDSGETLTMNESSGHVKVTFTGNDRNVYVVLRKFPASSVSLSQQGSKQNISRVSDVYHKVNSLIGNSMENPALFDNVIVASQNRFTLVFDSTPAEREAVFNPVFGTEIYRQMYNGILKKSCDSYNEKLVFAGGEIESARSQLKDGSELERTRENAHKEYLTASEKYAETVKRIETSEKEIRNFEAGKNIKEKLSITIRELVSQIDDKKNLVENMEGELNSAVLAAAEAAELKPSHDEYDKIKLESEKTAAELNELERAEKECLANKEQIAKREKDIAVSDGNRKTLISQIDGDNLSMKALLEEIASISGAVEKLEKDKKSSEAELSSLLARKKCFDDLHGKFKESSEKSAQRGILASAAERGAADEQELDAEIEKLEEKNEELEALRTKRDVLRAEITRHRTLLMELGDAERELSKQVCPFLKEQCRNIGQQGSLRGYFDPKRDELNFKIEDLERESVRYGDLDERIKKCGSAKSAKKEQLAALKKNIIDALNYRREEADLKQMSSEIAHQITKLFAGTDGKEASLILSDDYDGAAAVMQGAEAGHRASLDGVNRSVDEKRGEIRKKENDLSVIKRRIRDAENALKGIDREITEYNAEIASRVESAKIFEIRIEPLARLKQKYSEYASSIKALEPVDRRYRSAVQSAERRDELHKKLLSEKSMLDRMSVRHDGLCREHDAVVYNSVDHEKQVLVYNGLKGELKELNESLMNFKSAFDLALLNEENNNRLTNELGIKLKQVEHLARKKAMADRFRDDIKLLGPYLSERRTRMIAAAATVNYQRMTGRAERILWENAGEQYLVSVSSGSGKRRYNMLSGGEQVAVALSIRSALASEMTDCRFAIFDEPTINLDAEKKEALSVSLYDMLKNLEQAIVVTHDDTFREMAANIIELRRG